MSPARAASRKTAASGSSVLVALLALLAGAVATTSSVMHWMNIPGGIVFTRTVSVYAARGIDTPFGVACAAAGGLLFVAAVSWLTWARGRRWPAVLAVLAGTVILASTIYTLATLDARFTNFAVASVSSAALPEHGVRQVVATILGNGTTSIQVGTGLRLAFVAGALALLTGIVGLVPSRSTKPSIAVGWGTTPKHGRPSDSLEEVFKRIGRAPGDADRG